MKLIYAILLLPLLAFGAAPGDLVEGKWVQISASSGTGTTIQSVWPNTGSAAIKSSATGVMAFSGGVFATAAGSSGSLIVWGGGHNDYAGNEVYAFDIATGRWSVLSPPSSSGVCTYATSLYSDGKPCAPHTYDGLAYAPSTNQMFKLGPASDYSVGGGGTGNIDAFSFSGNTWTRKGRLATFQDLCSTGSGESGMSAWDSVNQVIWWHGVLSKYGGDGGFCGGAGGVRANILQKVNPVTGATTASYLGANSGIDGTMGFSPELKALIQLDQRSNKYLNVWDVASGTPVFYPNVSKVGTFPSDGDGFDWDPIAQKGVSYSGDGSSVITLTPPANWATTHTGQWTFATVTAGSGSASPTYQTIYDYAYGRFSYAPSLCGFVYVGGVNMPVYAYRLTGGAGPGCGGTPPTDPPPAVILNASPLSINTGGSTTLTWSTSNAGACTASATPAVTGWSGSKATSGTETVSPTASTAIGLDCTGLLSQTATHATDTVDITVNTGGGGTGDFATRCAAAGVKRCTSFDTDSDFTRGVLLEPAWDGNYYGTRDTAIKSSGAASLRFTVPVASQANTSGYWIAPLWDTTYVHPVSGVVGGTSSAHFVPGETLYWQYRQRFDANYINPATFNTSGWKQWILHPASGPSCIGYQVVQVNNYLRGFPQMYASCGGNHIEVDMPDGDIRLQQGPTIDCRYRNRTDTSPGTCKRYVADTWTTYYYKFTLGTYDTPTTHIEAWTGNDGEGPIKFMDYSTLSLPQEIGGDGLSRVQLTPYQTGKNSNSAAVATTWYDDLIVSTQPIAWPSGGSASPPPTVTLQAIPASIPYSGDSVLDWTSTDASTCTASGSWSGARATSGQQDLLDLTASGVYTLTCSGSGGTSAPATVGVTVASAPVVVDITANPATVPSGGASVITWTSTGTTGATPCTSTGGGWANTARAASGSVTSNALSANTSFTLDCTGTGTPGSDSVTVLVTTPQPTIDTLTASPNPVDYGAQSALTWTSSNATSCTFIAPFTFSVPVDGTGPSVTLTTATTVTLRCDNAQGSTTRSVLIGVTPIANATVTLTPVNPTITSGDSQLLTWTTTNANACTGTPAGAWNTAVAAAPGGGSLSVSPTTTTAYSITCTAAAGASASASTQVIVNSVVADPVVELVPAAGQIVSGNSTDLAWQVSDATSCTATGDWSGAKDPVSGVESTGVLAASKTYTLTCTNAGGGTGADTTQVIVTAAPVPPNTEIFATPSTIFAGDGVVINWNCTNSTSAVPTGGGSDPDWLSATSLSGSRTLYPTTTLNYTMTCTDGVTPDVGVATVTVNAARTLSLTAFPTAAFTNGSSMLTWATGGALDVCIWTNGPYTNTIVAADGSVTTGTLTVPTEFEILCGVGSELIGGLGADPRNNPAIKYASVTVNVTPNTPVNSRHRRRWWRFRR